MFCVCLFFNLQHVSLGQEWIQNLQGTGKNKNAGPLVQKILRILKGQQQSIKQSIGPFYVQRLWNCTGLTPMKLDLSQG